MSEVDLNDKVFGWKAKNHFYAVFAFNSSLCLLLLLAFIDWIFLPNDTPAGVRYYIFGFFISIPIGILFNSFTLILSLCPNVYWYGFLALFAGLAAIIKVGYGTWKAATIGYEEMFENETVSNVFKYYKCGTWAIGILQYFTTVSALYFTAVLLKLSFFYTPKPRVDLHSVQIRPPVKVHKSSESDEAPEVVPKRSSTSLGPIQKSQKKFQKSQSGSDSGSEKYVNSKRSDRVPKKKKKKKEKEAVPVDQEEHEFDGRLIAL
ncbi:unnamed protein product [Caenorhabditis sp. 36 PRJEB53466]|nr:unnamed protein product [Caenorhabditis sp. 36 PRJEB53466]